jgi:general stress protein 26
MDARALAFLKKHRISCLSVILADGSVHSATIHYSHLVEPLQFIFNTSRSTTKCSDMLTGKTSRASLVVGFSEEEFIEVQLRGTIHLVSDAIELESASQTHYTKYPDYSKYKNDPERVFLVFQPDWYRYSEFRAEPKLFVEEKLV